MDALIRQTDAAAHHQHHTKTHKNTQHPTQGGVLAVALKMALPGDGGGKIVTVTTEEQRRREVAARLHAAGKVRH